MSLWKLLNSLLIVIFAIISINVVSSTDYCSKKLCGGRKHVSCGYAGKFGEACPKDALVVPILDLEKFIVFKHNECRKNVCDGNFKGLETAQRMIELKWNKELADLAEATAKTCVYKHDECRNTETFNNVGQNIAEFATKQVAALNYTSICSDILDSWLRQAKNCRMELIQQFRADVGSAKVDDFTQMIRASCSQVGCAMVHYKKDGAKTVLFVCNYSAANEPNKPVYVAGVPCSACKAGCSFTSPGLCNTAEETFLLKLKLNVLGLARLKLKL